MDRSDRFAFDAPDLGRSLEDASSATLDALDYGVVEMDRDAIVRRYNATESRHSGLSPERAVGRHFFRDVAPCCDNRHVAHRYAQATLDETIEYTLAVRMRPARVVLRMLRHPERPTMHLLVRWP